MILFANLTQIPTTLADHKIKDAVDIKSDQTIEGIKIFTDTLIIKGHTFGKGGTFDNDLIINKITVGRGGGAIKVNNTTVGLDALHSNTTGNNNTAIGAFALYENKTGNNNTANRVLLHL